MEERRAGARQAAVGKCGIPCARAATTATATRARAAGPPRRARPRALAGLTAAAPPVPRPEEALLRRFG